MQDSLKLGFFVRPIQPARPAPMRTFSARTAKIVLADRLGYHRAFIGERWWTAKTITSSLAFIEPGRCLPFDHLGTGVLALAN